MFKKGLIAAMMASVTFVASAETTPAEEFTPIKASLSKAVGLDQTQVQLDSELTKVLRDKTGMDKHFVFTYGGQTLISDGEGKSLITDVSRLFVVDSRGPASNMFADHLFSQPENTQWVTQALPESIEKKADLYVVTDPTCGYCSKVEQQKAQYEQAGIQMHYIPYPRAGLVNLAQNPAYQKWAQAMCAENPAQAYHEIATRKDDNKYSKPVAELESCVEKIHEGYKFGMRIGVTGTPYMYGVSNTGETISVPGYKDASEVANGLGILIKKEASTGF